MMGIVVILGVSWLLLHFLQKENLSVLGFTPVPKALVYTLLGMIFLALVQSMIIGVETQIRNTEWANSGTFRWMDFLDALRYHTISALSEDLVFRGALLYILIQRIGAQRALILSSLCFGVYHWFSYGMLGENIIPLLYVLLITGFTGYSWAYTYVKTKSVTLGLGFHIGSNMLWTMFYPNAPYGEMLFVQGEIETFSEWTELAIAIFRGFTPGILVLLFVHFGLRNNWISPFTQVIHSQNQR